jgi:hypothetical protein
VWRGGYLAESILLLYGPHGSERSEVERRAAIWLLGEVDKLQSTGPSPVRTRGLLSRLQIADVAIAMLDYELDLGEKPAPQPELIELLARLLEVDRRRSAVANRPELRDEYQRAAMIDGELTRQGKTITVRELAKCVRVSLGTISAWRKCDTYKYLVEVVKRGTAESGLQ